MRAGLLRVVLTLLFASTAFHSSTILAQSGAVSAAANAVPANSGSSTQPKNAPQAGPSDKFAIPGCVADHTKLSDADKALHGRRYPDAERLYGAALQTDSISSSDGWAGTHYTGRRQAGRSACDGAEVR